MASTPLSSAVLYLRLYRPDLYRRAVALVAQGITPQAVMVDQAAVVVMAQVPEGLVVPGALVTLLVYRLLRVMQAVQVPRLLTLTEAAGVVVQALLVGRLPQAGMAVRVQRLQ
jgi:hypothetical protein